VDEEDGPERLFTPWTDPQVYEFDFDFLFATPAEAVQGKVEFGAEDEEGWVLCRVVITPVSV
jgi:hypothetical protein